MIIPSLMTGNIIKIKTVNNVGFVAGQGKILYFNKMDGDNYSCSLSQDLTQKRFVTIKPYQILEIIDNITGIIIFQHDPADGL